MEKDIEILTCGETPVGAESTRSGGDADTQSHGELLAGPQEELRRPSHSTQFLSAPTPTNLSSDMDTDNDSNVDVALLFQKPVDTTYELVKTFLIEQKEQLNESPEDIERESKVLQPLELKAPSESGESSCSEAGLPDDLLNEPLVDDVFEDSTEDVAADLFFQQPKELEVELVYTILKAENQFEDSADKSVEVEEGVEEERVEEKDSEDETVCIDLLFREPTNTSFELVYTIPLMEDVAIVNPEDVLAEVLEKIPPPEDLDNVVESVEADDVSAAEFTFSPKQTSGDEETVTAEVVTVLENSMKDEMGSEEAKDFIEKVKLTSDDTFDDVEDPKEEEAFQNAFVKSVETPPPEEDVPGDDDVSDSKEIDTAELTRKLSALADGEFPVDETESTPLRTESPIADPEVEQDEDVPAQVDEEIGEESSVENPVPENMDKELDSEKLVRKLSAMADEKLPVDEVENVAEDVPEFAEESSGEVVDCSVKVDQLPVGDMEASLEEANAKLEELPIEDAAPCLESFDEPGTEKTVEEGVECTPEEVVKNTDLAEVAKGTEGSEPIGTQDESLKEDYIQETEKFEEALPIVSAPLESNIDQIINENVDTDLDFVKSKGVASEDSVAEVTISTQVEDSNGTVSPVFRDVVASEEDLFIEGSKPETEIGQDSETPEVVNQDNSGEAEIVEATSVPDGVVAEEKPEQQEEEDLKNEDTKDKVVEDVTNEVGFVANETEATEVSAKDYTPMESENPADEMPKEKEDLEKQEDVDVVEVGEKGLEIPDEAEDGVADEHQEEVPSTDVVVTIEVVEAEEEPIATVQDVENPDSRQVDEVHTPGAVEEIKDAEKESSAGGPQEELPVQGLPDNETMVRVKKSPPAEELPKIIEPTSEDVFQKTTVTSEESGPRVPHKIGDIHFEIPKDHPDFGNDYVPFGTEPAEYSAVEFNVPEDNQEEEEDVVAELSFQPIRQWKDEDVISLQSLKSLVAEVGCTTEEQKHEATNPEETLKILKVVPSEPSLMELDITNDPSIIHVPIPLLEPASKYLEEMVDWIIADAVKEVGEMEVVTESELCEMKEESSSCPIPEPLEDMEFPFEAEVHVEDDEKTPEPEVVPEVLKDQEVTETAATPEVEEPVAVPISVTSVESAPVPQRPPRAPKQDPSSKSRVRFGPLSIKLGRSYSEEQKALEEMLEKPLEVIISSSQAAKKPEDLDDEYGGLSPLSPGTLDEYEHVPMMDMRSVPHSPQEKPEEEPVETKILGAGKSAEDVGRADEDDEGSEYLDSIGDLSERTIQRFNTSIDDPSVRRDSFSSISSFGDRQKFQTAIENIRHDLLPFQSSVSQYLVPSANPTQLVANLSMDSPSDLSPNAPPVGFENTAQFLEKLQAEDRPSAEGSIDSSGFEKVDHEGLEDYPPVADPMQQSVFGSLQADAEDVAQSLQADDGFVLIDRNEAEIEGGGKHKKKMSSHDDVIEKNYFDQDPVASATAKLLESPIAEEARKLVQDAVASASEISKQAVDDADEIGKELLENAEDKFEKVKEPVFDTLEKAHDGLGDFVHETVPKAVDDFVAKVSTPEPVHEKPDSPLPETPEPLVDIHDTVDRVHDEIDSFLRGREPTPPLEADEDEAQEHPHFGNQTPEEDETTFDRKGPLTIPEEVEKAAAQKNVDEFADFDPLVTANTGAAFGAAVSEALTEEEIFGHQKFETVPRPPTPPKDISDEDVKPSTVNLGPAHHHSHPSSPHHSILKHHGEPWVDFKTVPPCVLDVIYWRDAKKSAVVLSLALLALFILAKYPLLTVITYSLLLSLVAAAGFRVFKKVEAQIKKTDAEHPFSEILAQDLSLPQEKVHAQADVFVEHATCVANKLKKLVFVESPVESIKFGLVLWALTYVASWFSGFTIAILGLLGVFSVPKVYESNQDAIDPHLAVISGHLKNVQNIIDEKLPFLRSAPAAAEEKKDQ